MTRRSGKFSRNKKDLTIEYLETRITNVRNAGYPVSRWLIFSRDLIARGFTVRLYEAKATVSKYLTISRPETGRKPCVIRFSNHKPAKHREERGDCDFFVGRTNFTVTTTEDAKDFVEEWFG